MIDLRRAIRRLIRTPGFSIAALVTLALGVGANTAIFSVVNSALIRPLPYPKADEIVRIFSGPTGRGNASPPDFVDWRHDAKSFAGMAAMNGTSAAISNDGLTEEIDGTVVTGDFFDVVGIRPTLGRAVGSTDTRSVGTNVVVLSDTLWRRVFRADPTVIGRSVRMDDVSYTIIGVMPRGFSYPRGSEFWSPLAFTDHDLTTQRGGHYLDVVARLRSGVSLKQAQLELGSIWARLANDYPTKDKPSGAIVTLRTSLVGESRPALLILVAAVGLVLLIACANVANLLLVRALRRHREITVRAALGAQRGRLIAECLTEAVVLATAAGAVGVALAEAGTRLLNSLRPDDPILATAAIDWHVLLVAIGLSIGSGLLFGFIFAHQTLPRDDIGARLGAGGRSASEAKSQRRTKRVLAALEIALAVVLVSCAGLLVRSFLALRAVDPGFQATNRVVFDVGLPDVQFDTPEKQALFFSDLLAKIRAIPGVQHAAASTGVPMSGFRYSFSARAFDGRTLSSQEGDHLSTQVRRVSDDYFRVMGIPIRAGRGLGPKDRRGAQPVLVVNEAAARLLAPVGSPIGHNLEISTTFAPGPGRPRASGQIVGVVGDVRDFSLSSQAVPEIYFALDQYPADFGTITIQSTLDPVALTNTARKILAASAPDVAVYHQTTLGALEEASIDQPRFIMTLLAVFAAVAIVMAIVGLYGVIAFGVGERTREIGVRIALGAQRGDVARLVVSDALLLGAVGVAAGLAVSLATTRVLENLLYGVRPGDALTFVVTGIAMLMAALLAAWLPARRATRLDPVVAIRSD
jgi:putative ABC transport system permease protein